MESHQVSHWARRNEVLNDLTEAMNFSVAEIKDFTSSVNSLDESII
jgi:hypothetical protein